MAISKDKSREIDYTVILWLPFFIALTLSLISLSPLALFEIRGWKYLDWLWYLELIMPVRYRVAGLRAPGQSSLVNFSRLGAGREMDP
jgi:hypothetical protein